MSYFVRTLLAVLLPAAALAQAPASYNISGRIAGLPDGQRLYLIAHFRRIDSATVAGGAFVFRGRVAEPVFCYLYRGRGPGSSKLADFLLDNLPLAVTGERPVYEGITVRGSADTDQFNAWYQQDEQLAKARAKVVRAYKALQARQDTTATMLKVAATELQQTRVGLLKDYVQRNHDNAAGAALPTMCTLGASLTAADYREMYQVLEPRWQQSAFGTEIQDQIKMRTSGPPAAN